jgi:hypothetical protein
MGIGGCVLSVCALLLFSRIKPPDARMPPPRLPRRGYANLGESDRRLSARRGLSSVAEDAGVGARAVARYSSSQPTAWCAPCASPPFSEATVDEAAEENDDEGDSPTSALFGTCLALFAGLMYGIQFLPCSIYAANHRADPTVGSLVARLRVTLAQFMGSFLSAFCIYATYALVKAARHREVAQVPLSAMLPSMGAGALWAFSSICAMISMDALGVRRGLCAHVEWGLFGLHRLVGGRLPRGVWPPRPDALLSRGGVQRVCLAAHRAAAATIVRRQRQSSPPPTQTRLLSCRITVCCSVRARIRVCWKQVSSPTKLLQVLDLTYRSECASARSFAPGRLGDFRTGWYRMHAQQGSC